MLFGFWARPKHWTHTQRIYIRLTKYTYASREQPMDFKLIIPLDFRLHFDHNFLINYSVIDWIIIFYCCFNTSFILYFWNEQLFRCEFFLALRQSKSERKRAKERKRELFVQSSRNSNQNTLNIETYYQILRMVEELMEIVFRWLFLIISITSNVIYLPSRLTEQKKLVNRVLFYCFL